MTWLVGISEIRALLANGELEQVALNPDHATRLLAQARAHHRSALTLRDSDPTGAY